MNLSLHVSCELVSADELPSYHKHEGQVALQGVTVKNDQDFGAVCTEQEASPSQVAAAKFLDTISKFPGTAGELSDSESA